MDNQTLVRIPLKYWPILNTLNNESVGSIFKNILWWNEKLSETESVFYNLIMVDVNAINNRALSWVKWWRPKENKPKVIEVAEPKVIAEVKPNLVKTRIDKARIDNKIDIKEKDKKEKSEDKSSSPLVGKYFENEKVDKLFLDFLDMRKKTRKPATEKAIELLLKKLNKHQNDEVKAKMIENSIVWNRTWIFDLKEPLEKEKSKVHTEVKVDAEVTLTDEQKQKAMNLLKSARDVINKQSD